MITMSLVLRTFNRTLFCTYGAIRSLCVVMVTPNSYFRRLYTYKQRNLLSFVCTATSNIPTTKMSTEGAIKIATYDDVKALKDNKNVLLIDVRELSELKETGVLPGSINIPLGEVENVLKNTPADEFAKRFGRPKPDNNFPLVFSCYSGKRSQNASIIAAKLGYKNVTNYTGGWSDWEKKSKQ